jgi:hypothetical protein
MRERVGVIDKERVVSVPKWKKRVPETSEMLTGINLTGPGFNFYG